MATAAPSGLAPLSAPQAAGLAKDATTPVIVVLKDQHPEVPATPALARNRAAAVAGDQQPVISDLRLTGAHQVKTFSVLNAVAATVSKGEAARLAADPAVASVVPDVTWNLGQAPSTTTSGVTPALRTPSGQQVCPAPGKVQLNPEALQAIQANSSVPGAPTAASLGVDGKGVTVVDIAEGVDTHNPDFTRNGKSVFTDYQDFTGDGTAAPTSGGEAFLDASSIAAQGHEVYDLHQAGAPVPLGCNIRILGAAPGANLVGLKVFPSSNQAVTSQLVQAIDYAVTVDHVNVLNESFGYNPLPDTTADLVRQADDAAVAAGTTVVSSSGDAGPNGTLGSPSTDPQVIQVGGTTTFRAYAQADIGGYRYAGATGWLDNNISALSSGGTGQSGKGPDLVAPGDLNWVVCTADPALYSSCPSSGPGIEVSGGTSESAPLTSATAALVIQAYRQTHSGTGPTPALIKQILTSTADDLGYPGSQQGSGILDAYRAVHAALSAPTQDGVPTPSGAALLSSTSALSATEAPGTTERFPITLTNTGALSQSVTLAGRVLGDPTTVLDTSVTGNALVHFTVPAGASRLDAAIADVSQGGFISLLTPDGRFAAHSLPQGTTGSGHVDVAQPAAGTWTALVAGQGSTKVAASVSSYQAFGTVSPSSVVVAAGRSATVDVTVTAPSTPGDLSAAIQVVPSIGPATSIPVDLRTLVPLSSGRGTFSTTVTGGNGRGGAPAQTRYFQFDVPSGRANLDVATALPVSTGDLYETFLVSPDGQALAAASNQLAGTTAAPYAAGADLHVLAPAAGRWTVIVAVVNPVAGNSLSAALTGTVSLGAAAVTASGVPGASGTTLPAGTPATATVTIHNTSPTAQAYFVDGRSTAEQTVTLAPYTNATGVALPLTSKAQTPQWLVPTDTRALAASAHATAPVTFDWAPYLGTIGGAVGGDPDLGATTIGNAAYGSYSAATVTPGDWFVDPALIGPFGTHGAAPASVDLSMTATTRAFDPAVTSSTGDLWLRSVNAAAPAVTPVVIPAGGTATITVTITPTAAAGTVVSGDLFVDSTTLVQPFGTAVAPTADQVAAIPYRYTVG